MKGDHVPDPDHISRYCSGRHTNDDGTINGSAFRLRDRDNGPEDFLSVNWLEFLKKENRDAEISEIRSVFTKKLSVGPTAKIAVLNVGRLCQYISTESPDRRKLRVLHEPEEPDDPSHSGIFNLKLDDDLIADLIAEIVQETYLAKERRT